MSGSTWSNLSVSFIPNFPTMSGGWRKQSTSSNRHLEHGFPSSVVHFSCSAFAQARPCPLFLYMHSLWWQFYFSFMLMTSLFVATISSHFRFLFDNSLPSLQWRTSEIFRTSWVFKHGSARRCYFFINRSISQNYSGSLTCSSPNLWLHLSPLSRHSRHMKNTDVQTDSLVDGWCSPIYHDDSPRHIIHG